MCQPDMQRWDVFFFISTGKGLGRPATIAVTSITPFVMLPTQHRFPISRLLITYAIAVLAQNDNVSMFLLPIPNSLPASSQRPRFAIKVLTFWFGDLTAIRVILCRVITAHARSYENATIQCVRSGVRTFRRLKDIWCWFFRLTAGKYAIFLFPVY